MSGNKIKRRVQQTKNIARNLKDKILEFLDNRALPTSMFIDEEDYKGELQELLKTEKKEEIDIFKKRGGQVKKYYSHGSSAKKKTKKKKPRGWGIARYKGK